jgi:aryl-alcohol dehydrogenase-like predicted oxidoreductase
MDYVRFGKSSLKVSRVALGAMGFGNPAWRKWVLPEAESRPLVRMAVEAGINLVDTCDFYSGGDSEEILGSVLWDYAKRDEIVLATKAGNPMGKHPNARGFSRKHLFNAIDDSLRRLRTDYVDLFQTHIWDPATDLEELATAFSDIVRSGKARYVGATTMPAWSFVRTIDIARDLGAHALCSMQCEYNLCHREAERELIPFCRHAGIALIPFSPLARGFLCADRRDAANSTPRHESDDYTLKYYHRPQDHAVQSAVARIAIDRGVPPAAIALAWVLQQPGMTAPIVGATSPAQMQELLDNLDLRLTAEETTELEAPYLPRPVRASAG